MSHTKPDADYEYRLEHDTGVDDPKLDGLENYGDDFLSEELALSLVDHEIQFIYRDPDSGKEGMAYYHDNRYGRKPWGSDY